MSKHQQVVWVPVMLTQSRVGFKRNLNFGRPPPIFFPLKAHQKGAPHKKQTRRKETTKTRRFHRELPNLAVSPLGLRSARLFRVFAHVGIVCFFAVGSGFRVGVGFSVGIGVY